MSNITAASPEKATSYSNPVYDRSFPDPFVLKHRGIYFAYCTGFAADGRVFGVMRSRDLVHWDELNGAMGRLGEPHPHYWAPEVTFHNGKFFLYYSVGNETLMEIRVAVADEPDGDFSDMGIRLTDEEFAIDPHVVRDEKGGLFMFYATDFLDHSHIGTGTVVDRMIDPFTMAKAPRPVTRARYDWQIYDPARKEKGGVRWHTVEGPFVLKRKGMYYQMFSGGNWQNETYGVSYAVSTSLESDDEWEQYSDGDITLPVLRTIPGRVLGPGHNSVVRGLNDRELYCVYHRWSGSERVLAIDRMDFSGPGQLFVNGPTDTPQPFPWLPERLLGEGVTNSEKWEALSGTWESAGPVLLSNGNGEILFTTGRRADFRCVIWLRALDEGGAFGVRLKSSEIPLFTFLIDSKTATAYAEWSGSGGKRPCRLPPGFDVMAPHRITLDLEGETASISVDEGEIIVSSDLPVKPSGLSLFSEGMRAEFGPVDVTFGFEELFLHGALLKRGWDHYSNVGTIRMSGGLLTMEGTETDVAVITRNVEAGDFELCFNMRFAAAMGADPKCTFGCGNMFTIAPLPDARLDSEGAFFPLPGRFDPFRFVQFRMVRKGGRTDGFIGRDHVGSVPAKEGEFVRLTVQSAVVEIEMVRYTLI